MGLNFEYIPGQTPLEEEEKEKLLISSITTRSELDEFEQFNISQAVEWTPIARETGRLMRNLISHNSPRFLAYLIASFVLAALIFSRIFCR